MAGNYGKDGLTFDMFPTNDGTDSRNGVEDVERSTDPYTAPLHRKLKARHLQMIAIGGKIALFLSLHRAQSPDDGRHTSQALLVPVYWSALETLFTWRDQRGF